MKIQDSVVFVTGGGRGLGKALVDEVLARGAAKVYATARDPKTITNPDVVPLRLEVTDPASVAAAVAQAPDVNLLVNNAGAALAADYLQGDLEEIRREFEINFYGPLQNSGPSCAQRRGGAVLPGAGIRGGEVTPGRFQRGAIKAARQHHTGHRAARRLRHPAAPSGHALASRRTASATSGDVGHTAIFGAVAGPGPDVLAGPGRPAVTTCPAPAGL